MQPNRLKRLFAALLCLGATLTASSEEVQMLFVTTPDGTSKALFTLSAKPSVTFTATEAVLTDGVSEVRYALSDRISLTVAYGDPNGIAQTTADGGALIKWDGNRLTVARAARGTAVTVHDAAGRLLASTTVGTDGTAALTIAADGVCVVRVGELSFKIK